jgi:hypothetical protein
MWLAGHYRQSIVQHLATHALVRLVTQVAELLLALTGADHQPPAAQVIQAGRLPGELPQ